MISLLIFVKKFIPGLSLLVLFSCSIQKYPKKWIRNGIVPSGREVILNVGSKGKDLKILYTGSGGLAIDDGKEVILTDPFYSNNSLFAVMFGKIKAKSSSINIALKRFEESGISLARIKHVFIAHSHYDHLLDLPYLYKNKLPCDDVKIYGDKSSFNILKPFIDQNKFKSIENEAYYHFLDSLSNHKWIYLSDKIRVLPIEAHHAPHLSKIHLMKGEVAEEGIKDFYEPESKTKASRWKEGKVYSFLIDYLINEQIELRLFIQSSSCEPPFGFPPTSELKKKKIDIALIGVASAQNVKSFPDSLLELINPEKVILIHWEDFFRSYTKSPKTVRATNFRRFFKHLKRTYKVAEVKELKGKVIMPKPGVTFKISY